MTNASIKNTFSVLFVFAIALSLSMGAFAIVAHADDLGYADTYGDNLGYADTYNGNLGYADTYGSNLGYANTYGDNLGYSNSYGDNLGYADTYGTNLGYADTSGAMYGTDVYGTDVTYQNGIGYTYQDYGFNSGYSYGGGSSYGGGYSVPSFSFSAPATSYSSQGVYQQQQQQQQQQIRTVSTPSNNTTTSNYCTNNSCNYTDNSNNSVNISNSGNTSNVTTVSPVRSGSAQYAVQYVYPQTYTYPTFYQNQTYNSVSCYISSSQNYISWAASGATSAWLSGVGTVSPTGSMAVSSTGGTYTLTVSGPGGSNTCSTYVSGVTYNNTSVSLSQIPYTGFDFGPVGNALYWLALLAFAAAGAYLLVYYRGGMTLLANSVVARTTSVASAPARVVKKTAQKIENAIAAERSALENLPVAPSILATTDSMTVTRSKDGNAPRIIITRS